MHALLIALALAGTAPNMSSGKNTTTLRTTLLTHPPQGVLMDIPASTPGTSLVDTKGGVITCTRNAIGTYFDAAGVMQTASANQVRVEPLGMLSEEARTNVVTPSENIITGTSPTGPWTGNTFDVGWTADTVMTANPTGATSAVARINFAAVNNTSSILYQACGTGTNAKTISVWLKTESGTATVYLAFNGNTAAPSTVCNVTTTWTRFSHSEASTASNYFMVGHDGKLGSGVPTVQPAETVLVWGAQKEDVAAFATSYIPTAGTSVQRLQDVISITARSMPAVGAPWYVTMTATPLEGRWSQPPGNRVFWMIGTSFQGTNTWDMRWQGTGDEYFYDEVFGASGNRIWNSNTSSSTAATYRWASCYDGTTSVNTYRDGTVVGYASGTGTALASISNVVTLGNRYGSGLAANANIKSFRIAKGCVP